MANAIEICNIALSRIGKNAITSFTQASEEARRCSTNYPAAVLATLNDFDWGFARGSQSLSVLDETFPGWDFVYAAPADMVAARLIFNPQSKDDLDRIPYETGISQAGNTPTVLTDYPNAILIYTRTLTNPTVFDAQFCDALEWKLAAELAQPLKADLAMGTAARNNYSQVILTAKARNANQQSEKPSSRSSFVDFR